MVAKELGISHLLLSQHRTCHMQVLLWVFVEIVFLTLLWRTLWGTVVQQSSERSRWSKQFSEYSRWSKIPGAEADDGAGRYFNDTMLATKELAVDGSLLTHTSLCCI